MGSAFIVRRGAPSIVKKITDYEFVEGTIYPELHIPLSYFEDLGLYSVNLHFEYTYTNGISVSTPHLVALVVHDTSTISVHSKMTYSSGIRNCTIPTNSDYVCITLNAVMDQAGGDMSVTWDLIEGYILKFE